MAGNLFGHSVMYRTTSSATAVQARSSSEAPSWRASWKAALDLHFSSAGERTVLVRKRHTGPLSVQKALYPEGAGICHAVILHPPGGVAAGDDLQIDVSLGQQAAAVLSTPGATKWYKAGPSCPGTQQVRITMQRGARLDWLPQENIYFDRSYVRQTFTLQLARDASAMGWDISQLGRRDSGETWRDAGLHMHLRLLDATGCPIWEERQALHSGDAILMAAQGLAGLPVYGTLWAAGVHCNAEAAQRIGERLPFGDALRAGATALPGGLLLVRAVADEPETIRNLFIQLWLQLRQHVHGVPGQPLRLWST